MSIYKKAGVIGLSVIALQAITSLAGVTAQESLLSTLDKDQDGLISLQEASGHQTLSENFMLIDVNEDGFISIDELMASELTKG